MSPAEQLRFVAAVQRLMVNKDYLLGGSVVGTFVIKQGQQHGCYRELRAFYTLVLRNTYV